MMLLTVGALAIYQSMGASTELVENSSRHLTATQLGASEIEKVRALPYDVVAMRMPTAGTTYFEGAEQVTDAADGRVEPSTDVERDRVIYTVDRAVTWRSADVNGTTTTRAFKQVTVIVSWSDERGDHDIRSSSAVSRTSSP